MTFAAPRLAAGFLLALFAATLAGAQARPVTPAEKRFAPYAGRINACDDPAVLGRIQSRFAAKESEYWNSALQIASFDRIRQIGLRSWGLDHIPRRYCMARAYLNDGRRRAVSYWVGEDLGIIGWGFGVEWCVHGLDRNLAFAPNCKMARP